MKKTIEQIEAEKLSRRQALGRIGFLAGAAAVASLTSDELTRLVGRELQKRSGDNKVVDQVAKELQASGVAGAAGVAIDCDPQSTGTSCYGSYPGTGSVIGYCNTCCENLYGFGKTCWNSLATS